MNKIRFWSGDRMFYMTNFESLRTVMDCLKQQFMFDLHISGITTHTFDNPYDHNGLHGASFQMSTGLIDVTGREIYEGDIVVENIMGERIFSEITYGTGNNMHPCFCYKFRDGSGYDQLDGNDNLIVIGNIYENPERNIK